MQCSSYNPSDSNEIEQLFGRVFTASEGEAEGLLISKLVAELQTTDSQDIFGFTAKEEGKLLACIFFSRLFFEPPLQAFILSPVAVATEYQGQGIGKTLITWGLNQLKSAGVDLVFTYGDPRFYTRVGFRPISETIVKAPLKMSQPEGWLCQSLTGSEVKPLQARPRCVSALNKPEYW